MQCPGEGCDIWDAAAGDYEYKVETKVCSGCRDCGGVPPKPPAEDDPEYDDLEELEDLFDEIEDIIEWENGGFVTDWTVYPFEVRYLVRIWRNCELEIKRLQASWLHAYIKAKCKG